MGYAFGGATWAFTRNPLRGMAVLLAANPKPAVSSAEYAWRQGDLVARERGYVIPNEGSLSQLSRERSYLTMCLVYSVMKKRRLAAFQKMKGKFVHGSFVTRKSEHDWKDEVVQRAKQTRRTLRKAFEVEADDEGIKGEIQGMPSLSVVKICRTKWCRYKPI